MTIIEGEYFTEEQYKKVKADYINDKLSTAQIKEKYNLTTKFFGNLVHQINEETGFSRGELKPKKQRKHKFYYYDRIHKGFRVQKTVGGEQRYYGIYRNKETTEKIVEELKKVDWDKSQLEAIKEKVGV